jgi:hypothetical protein
MSTLAAGNAFDIHHFFADPSRKNRGTQTLVDPLKIVVL